MLPQLDSKDKGRQQTKRDVQWQRPPVRMLKVNIDASWSTAEQEGKMVLIVRDSLGECIYACGQGLGPVASAHLAELLSLRLACEI